MEPYKTSVGPQAIKVGKEVEGYPQSSQNLWNRRIKFGHMCYVVLSAIVMIDFFPDHDLVNKYLNCNQGCAVQLIPNLIMKSL